MRTMLARSTAVLATLVVTSTAAHAQLFYNGEFDGVNGLASAQNSALGSIYTYENFTVGGNWSVNAVFGEFLAGGSWSSAYWEIRSGVSAGNGGTLVASGTNAATQTATGRNGFGYTEYRATVTGFTPFALGPGQYWITVAPVVTPSDLPYVSTTSGANGVNAVIDRTNNYLDSPANGFSFASDYTPSVDYAYGVDGTAMSAVPEPATFVLVGGGLAGLAFVRRRRKTA